VPYLSQAEWDLLNEGIDALSPGVQEQVRSRADELEHAQRPIVCPLLDREARACLVYSYRPVACRTYGFYVERDKGLYCHIIQAEQARGQLDGIVWGNAEAVERERATLGVDRSLVEWLKEDRPTTNGLTPSEGDIPKSAP
jgi:uncharacterized protein